MVYALIVHDFNIIRIKDLNKGIKTNKRGRNFYGIILY